MPSVWILSKTPDDTLSREFEALLHERFQVDVERRTYEGNFPPVGTVVFAEHYSPKEDFTQTAQILALQNITFVLQRGLGYSRDDLLERGLLRGLEGVAYHTGEFGAFTQSSGDLYLPEDVLRGYLVSHGHD